MPALTGAMQGKLDAAGLKIGVVTARFNSAITGKLEEGALAALEEMKCTDVPVVRVPGAIEIALAAKALLSVGCDAVVAIGTVIRGDTTHYEFVCNSVERACTLLQLETGKPVASGVLTVENEQQALDRAGGKHGNKGAEAARVAVEMARLVALIGAR
jgi:6,7-dimethyl-8-ribityllumazine synthase